MDEQSNISKELTEEMDKSILAEKILNSKEGKFQQDMAEKTIERAIYLLCFKVDLSHAESVIRLVERIRWLKYEWKTALEMQIKTGEIAFDELKERDLLQTNSVTQPINE